MKRNGYLKSGFPRGIKLVAGEDVDISDRFTLAVELDGTIKRAAVYDGHGGGRTVYPYKRCKSGGYDLIDDLDITNVKRRWGNISWH